MELPRLERLRRSLGTGACLAALVVGASAQRARPAAPRNTNVLLIVLDDLGTDQLAFYGETPTPPSGMARSGGGTRVGGPVLRTLPATPNLDQLRRQGIWFTKAYGTPVCSSTRACIQTGRYGFRTGVGWITNAIGYPGDFELPNAEKLLPELLRDGLHEPSPWLPYRCGAFGKWHLSTLLEEDRGHAVENGYHRFRGTMGNVGAYYRYDWIEHDVGSPPVAVRIDGQGTHTTDSWHGSVTRREALEWIQAQTSAFFAYVAFGPPHAPLQVPPLELLPQPTRAALARFGLAAGNTVPPLGPPDLVHLVYRSQVEAVDAEIGNLIDGIPAETRKNTMIIVMGDNGTPGVAVSPPHDPDHAKSEVYELGIRVPLIVTGPLVKKPIPSEGWRSEALVSAVDLWLTIADITGASPGQVVPPHQLDSISFLPVIRDPLSAGNRTTVYSQLFSPNGFLSLPPPSCYDDNDRSMSDGFFKYIRMQQSLSAQPCGIPTYKERLYHLPTDPEEQLELLGAGPLSPEAANAYAFLKAEMDALSGL
jgi:arylsulfatase A-like enzyme